MNDTIMVRIDAKLVEEARRLFPETKGLTATGLIDLLMRRCLHEVTESKKA